MSYLMKSKYELHVSGLPPNTTDFQLAEEFGTNAPVLNVYIDADGEGRCKGSAVLLFADFYAAKTAAESVQKFRGIYPISVIVMEAQIIQEPQPLETVIPKETTPTAPSTNTIDIILSKLENHPDKKGFVSSSMIAFMEHVAGVNIGKTDDLGELEELSDEQTELRTAAVLCPSMVNYLDATPNCKALLARIRASPHNDDKTPASLIHEYAFRSQMKLEYVVLNELSAGPYIVECILSAKTGDTRYVVGNGEARTKKDAKQAAAASAIEALLETTDPKDFMISGKNKVNMADIKENIVGQNTTNLITTTVQTINGNEMNIEGGEMRVCLFIDPSKRHKD